VKTNFGGPHQTKGCSMLAPFTASLSVMMAFLFFERVFSTLANQSSFESAFFAWSAALGKILTMGYLRSDMSLRLISVICSKEMGSP
jgi:hypothetical protein